jgi:hypothetical protein
VDGLSVGAVGVTTGLYASHKIYSFANGRTDVYDPVQNIWSTVEPMSIPRNGFGVAVLDDIL